MTQHYHEVRRELGSQAAHVLVAALRDRLDDEYGVRFLWRKQKVRNRDGS